MTIWETRKREDIANLECISLLACDNEWVLYGVVTGMGQSTKVLAHGEATSRADARRQAENAALLALRAALTAVEVESGRR